MSDPDAAQQALRVSILRRTLCESDPTLDAQLCEGGEPEGLTDAQLGRWLQARKWKADSAASHILKHAKWRSEVGLLTEESVLDDLSQRKLFLQGCDRAGRPVLFGAPKLHPVSDDQARVQRLTVFAMDACVRYGLQRRGWDGTVVAVFDLTGLSGKNYSVRELSTVFSVLTEHYPQRLGLALVIDAPLLFSVAWKVAAGATLDASTRAKVKFVSKREADKQLKALVDPQVLPESHGGTAAWQPLQDALGALAPSSGGGLDSGAAAAAAAFEALPYVATLSANCRPEAPNAATAREWRDAVGPASDGGAGPVTDTESGTPTLHDEGGAQSPGAGSPGSVGGTHLFAAHRASSAAAGVSAAASAAAAATAHLTAATATTSGTLPSPSTVPTAAVPPSPSAAPSAVPVFVAPAASDVPPAEVERDSPAANPFGTTDSDTSPASAASTPAAAAAAVPCAVDAKDEAEEEEEQEAAPDEDERYNPFADEQPAPPACAQEGAPSSSSACPSPSPAGVTAGWDSGRPCRSDAGTAAAGGAAPGSGASPPAAAAGVLAGGPGSGGAEAGGGGAGGATWLVSSLPSHSHQGGPAAAGDLGPAL